MPAQFTPLTLFSDLPTIETPRMVLRKPRLEDAEDVFAYAKDPEVSRFMPWQAHRSVEDSLAYLRLTLDQNARGDRGTWAVTFKEEDLLVGAFAYHAWSTAYRRASVGYILDRRFWNKGIVTEVMRRMVEFGFEAMDLNRIEATCDDKNVGSYRVMEKNGLKLEGLLRQHEYFKGRYRDTRVYSILRSEWGKGTVNGSPFEYVA